MTVGEFGQLLSGIGLITGAIIGIYTAVIYNARQRDDAWLDRFRGLYEEFWKNPEMEEVRRWIVNENDYKNLDQLLRKRNETRECVVSIDDHKKLEKIDKFCSLMVRARTFGELEMRPRQRLLWSKLLYGFWHEKMKNRESLRTYIRIHWPELDESVGPSRGW